MTEEICNGRLHPMVITRERVSGESTYILTGELGKSTDVFIATFEPHEATVIEVTVNMETVLKMLAAPENAHRMFQTGYDNDGGR
jgi:hypothetical protein